MNDSHMRNTLAFVQDVIQVLNQLLLDLSLPWHPLWFWHYCFTLISWACDLCPDFADYPVDVLNVAVLDSLDEERMVFLLGVHLLHDFRVLLGEDYGVEFELQEFAVLVCKTIVELDQVGHESMPRFQHLWPDPAFRKS